MRPHDPTDEEIKKTADDLVRAGFSEREAYWAIGQLLHKPLDLAELSSVFEPTEYVTAIEPGRRFGIVLGANGNVIVYDPDQWKRVEWWGRQIMRRSAVEILDFVASVDRTTMPFKPPH